MALTLAFVMDPLEGVNIHTDTSFAFMLAAQEAGHSVVHVSPKAGLALHGDDAILRGHRVRVANKAGAHFESAGGVTLTASECHAIFIRTDPPFDVAYLTATWILSFAERKGVLVVNSPRGIRSANEKLYALQWKDLTPRTRVTANRDEVSAWVASLGGEAIAKPIDGHGGYGVVRLRTSDSNLHALVEMLTQEGRQPIVVQEYLPDAAKGDRRLLVLDGEVCGAVVRVPRQDDHRGNVHVGGRAVATEITNDDRRIVAAMREQLRADGLFFVGLDVIAGKLIEVNVTSPTLVQELRDLGGPDLAREMIVRVERLVGIQTTP